MNADARTRPAKALRTLLGGTRLERRLDPVTGVLFLAMSLLAVLPLRTVFVSSIERTRLFQSVVATILVVVVSGQLVRLTKIPWWLHPFVATGLLGGVVFWLVRGDATFKARQAASTLTGAPAKGWVVSAIDAARMAVSAIDTVKRPAPVLLGYGVIAIAMIGALTIISHLLAFDLDATFESVVPPAAVLVATSALGPGRGSDTDAVRFAVMFVVVAGAFVLADGGRRRRQTIQWIAGTRPAKWRVIAVFALFAVLAVGIGSSLLDRVGARYRVERERDAPRKRTRTVANPLVSIRPRLVNLTEEVMFTVDSRTNAGDVAPSYWRQAALDRFDGTSFTPAPRGFTSVLDNESIGVDDVTLASGATITQRIRIDALNDPWLPTAYRLQGVIRLPEGRDASAEAITGSLLLDSPTTPGQTYSVRSVLPLVTQPDPVYPSPDRRISESALDLSAGVDPAVKRLANQVIEQAGAGDADDFTKATALEAFFRSRFQYSTSVTWHGDDPLVVFLQERKGYCEQFASAFVVLARSLGIPARVAVGFTAGELGPDARFVVRGRNAHAWPELLLPGHGWVPFEPTPNRRRIVEILGADVSVPTTVGPAPSVTAPTVPPEIGPTISVPPQAPEPEGPSTASKLAGLALKVVLANLLFFAVFVGLPVIGLRARRAAVKRRVEHGLTPDRARLEWAWYELVRTVRAVARQPVTEPTLTPNDVAAMVRTGLIPQHSETVAGIARRVTAARFAPTAPATPVSAPTSTAVASDATGSSSSGSPSFTADAASADALEAELRRSLTRAQRWRRWLGVRVR